MNRKDPIYIRFPLKKGSYEWNIVSFGMYKNANAHRGAADSVIMAEWKALSNRRKGALVDEAGERYTVCGCNGKGCEAHSEK